MTTKIITPTSMVSSHQLPDRPSDPNPTVSLSWPVYLLVSISASSPASSSSSTILPLSRQETSHSTKSPGRPSVSARSSETPCSPSTVAAPRVWRPRCAGLPWRACYLTTHAHTSGCGIATRRRLRRVPKMLGRCTSGRLVEGMAGPNVHMCTTNPVCGRARPIKVPSAGPVTIRCRKRHGTERATG